MQQASAWGPGNCSTRLRRPILREHEGAATFCLRCSHTSTKGAHAPTWLGCTATSTATAAFIAAPPAAFDAAVQQPMQQVPVSAKVASKQPSSRTHIHPALLTSRIKRCTDWQQLAQLFYQHRWQMDYIHISAALTHLAKVCAPQDQALQSTSPPSTRSTSRHQLSALMSDLVQATVEQSSFLRGRELCNVLWATSKLGGMHVWDSPAPRTSAGATSDAASTLGSQKNALEQSFAVELLLRELPRCVASCNGQELSNLLYALALMGRPLCGTPRQPAGRRWWVGAPVSIEEAGESSREVPQSPESREPREPRPLGLGNNDRSGEASASTSWGQGAALGGAGESAEGAAWSAGQPTPDVLASGPGRSVDLRRPVLRALASALAQGQLGPQALSNTAWALGRLTLLGDTAAVRLVPALLGPAALGGPALFELPPEGLSAAAVGLAWLGARPRAIWCARLGVATLRVLPVASTQALCNTLWALVSMGRKPPTRWLTMVLLEVQRRLQAGGPPVVTPHDAGTLLYCLARLGVRPPLSLLGPLMACLHSGLVSVTSTAKVTGKRSSGSASRQTPAQQGLEPQAMANVMLALWRVNARPSADWVEALLRAAYTSAPGFTPQGAHMLLSGLEGLGFKPSRRFVVRLGAHLPEGWREAAQHAVEVRQAQRRAALLRMAERHKRPQEGEREDVDVYEPGRVSQGPAEEINRSRAQIFPDERSGRGVGAVKASEQGAKGR